MADNLPRGRTAIRCYPDLGVIWNVWQYSSLVAAIKVSFLFLLVLSVQLFELLEILPVWGQFLFRLWNVRTDLSTH